jgi:hypothetical protein
MISLLKKVAVSCLLILSFTLQLQAEPLENQKIITIHGYSSYAWTMYYQARPLEKEKAQVTHWSYSSEYKTIYDHAADLVQYLQQEAAADPGEPICFFTHSMGGLVLRAALNHPDCPIEAKMGRAVLLTPPNQGAALGRLLYEYSLVRYWYGNFSGLELLTAYDFEQLGQFPDTMQVLVVAGNSYYHNIIMQILALVGDASDHSLMQGEHDSRVFVAETYLTTPHYHVIVGEGHTSILWSKNVSLLARDFFASDTLGLEMDADLEDAAAIELL